jgi:hypothetical protein
VAEYCAFISAEVGTGPAVTLSATLGEQLAIKITKTPNAADTIIFLMLNTF